MVEITNIIEYNAISDEMNNLRNIICDIEKFWEESEIIPDYMGGEYESATKPLYATLELIGQHRQKYLRQ